MITRAIQLLHPDGELFEIRLINKSYNASGYFTNAETAIRALQLFKGGWKKEESAKKSNIFITMNPVNTACYSRTQKDCLIENISPTTKDDEITAFHWFLIDLDPKRISGVSSSNDELQCAWSKAQEIHNYLLSKGWKEPIQAMSGNGFHLVYRFDVPNIPENAKLWEQALKVLQEKFGDNTVDVDTTVFNPARICKLWGTVAQKGATTPERPHRKAHILKQTPEKIEINDINCIKTLVEELAPAVDVPEIPVTVSVPTPDTELNQKKSKSDFSIEDFINRYQIPVTSIEHTHDGATKYILEHCLFDESHKNKDAAIIKQADGKLGYKCFHAHCSEKHWKDVRLLFEPHAYDVKQEQDKKKYISPYDVDGTGTLTVDNLKAYMQSKGYTVQYNVITHDLEYNGFTGESKEHLQENAPALISDTLQFELKKCSTGNVAEKLLIIGTRNKVNPVLDKIRDTVWDGIDRIEEIYHIFGISETDTLSRILIKKWLMQCICGLYNNIDAPFSLDIILVFQGKQGIGKTGFFKHLAMSPKYFNGGACLDPRDKDSIMQNTSVWICELGEIGSTMKKDMDSVKAFLTKDVDNYRAPYGHTTLKYPRITSYVGTVNDEEFLIDQTGNRRFATIPISPDIEIDYKTQVEPFNALQLWAQVYSIVQAEIESGATISGCFRLTNTERKFLDQRNDSFTKPMKAETEVLEILMRLETETPPQNYVIEKRWITTTEFLEMHNVLSKYNAKQIGKVLEKYGYTLQKKNITNNGIRTSVKLRLLPVKRYVGN